VAEEEEELEVELEPEEFGRGEHRIRIQLLDEEGNIVSEVETKYVVE